MKLASSMYLAAGLAGATVVAGQQAASADNNRTSYQASNTDQAQSLTKYQVQPGDNLYRLSLRFNTTVKNLQAINSIQNPNVIRAGAYILVPATAQAAPAAQSLQTSQPVSVEATAQPQGYFVDQAADFLTQTRQAVNQGATAVADTVSSDAEDQALQTIIFKESSGNVNARNGIYYGIGQLSPQARAQYGGNTADYNDQLQAMKGYIADRYGSATAALAHHQIYNWY
ncbi:LysM peptidoglycan-binding domain-containing protein [Eupransor demetentiae]|uniref:LysM repeat (LysM) n=1 Tax=Eupransor demetentiae TaxID=3109584 RepID=A0ABM9N5C8_9LACO|nr:LysM repeat (LysM) [Lactobacillaceae bacterium LMG 33000]